MLTTAIFPARYVQGENALDHLAEEVARLGSHGVVVLDAWAVEHLAGRLDGGGTVTLSRQRFGGECSDAEINRLAAAAREESADVIIGVGGGKTLDTVKAVAHELSLPVVIVPTIASTDAPCSALSVIYTEDGEVVRYLLLPRNPDVVLVDTGVIARAPTRFLVAGMGDALATWFEAEDCRIKRGTNMTGRLGPMTAYGLARLCYDTLLEYGLLARVACDAQAVTPALERVIEANTLLSGLGFESGGLAAAHAIHNGLTLLPECHEYWHGEKVAFGTLSMLMLTDRPARVIDEAFDFCVRVGLPTTLADLGLEDVSDQRLLEVAARACAEGETIHNEPYEVTPARVLAAMRAADAEGRRRRAG